TVPASGCGSSEGRAIWASFDHCCLGCGPLVTVIADLGVVAVHHGEPGPGVAGVAAVRFGEGVAGGRVRRVHRTRGGAREAAVAGGHAVDGEQEGAAELGVVVAGAEAG